MPGRDGSQANVTALARGYHIDSAVELVKNEGTDTGRLLTLDWNLNLI